MRKVHVHGRLKALLPDAPFALHVASVAEAVRCLLANFPALAPELAKGRYEVVCGARATGERLGEDALDLYLPEGRPVHIVPVGAARKNQGLAKTVMGVALIGIATVASAGAFGGFAALQGTAFAGVGWGTVAMIGGALALGGIATLLTPTPKTPSTAGFEQEDKPSFLLGGPVNATLQGNPVPIVGGRIRVGGVVMSGGISVERIPA